MESHVLYSRSNKGAASFGPFYLKIATRPNLYVKCRVSEGLDFFLSSRDLPGHWSHSLWGTRHMCALAIRSAFVLFLKDLSIY